MVSLLFVEMLAGMMQTLIVVTSPKRAFKAHVVRSARQSTFEFTITMSCRGTLIPVAGCLEASGLYTRSLSAQDMRGLQARRSKICHGSLCSKDTCTGESCSFTCVATPCSETAIASSYICAAFMKLFFGVM